MKQLILPFMTKAVALGLCTLAGVATAATITVNTADNADYTAGKMNLYRAITNASPGDTIAFNIPGAGPHYLQVPPLGFPLIYRKHNLTIDGYTQPGAQPNTNPITSTNNAVLKIVIDGRNMNARMMDYSMYNGTGISEPPIDNTSMSTERTGYGDTEWALLGVYRSTNVTIRGLAFLGDDGILGGISVYGIALAHDFGLDTTVKDRLAYDAGSTRNAHISGCWFGVNPTNPTPEGVVRSAAGVAFFRHREASAPIVPSPRPELPNESITVGVKPGVPNPRSQFNVFAGTYYGLAGEAVRSRVSGNFFGVLPNGSVYDPSSPAVNPSLTHFEIGRYSDTQPIIIGTDGDGVNDADEGNVFGPIANTSGSAIAVYGTSDKLYVVSGNRFGIALDGTRLTNYSAFIDEINVSAGTKLQLGSDFNGVSDVLEANHIYNNHPIDFYGTTPGEDPPMLVNFGNNPPNAAAWVSVRGNVLVNNGLVPYRSTDYLGQAAPRFFSYSAAFMNTNDPVIPQLSASTSTGEIIGTCASTNGGSFSNIVVDVYVLDPEGWTNGARWGYLDLNFTNGFPQGKAYLGSFVDNGPLDRDPGVAKFNFAADSIAIPAGAELTITANYSQDPPGTARGRTYTSNFSNPVKPKVSFRVTSLSRAGNSLTISWSGGTAPFTLQKKSPITAAWTDVRSGIMVNSATDTIGSGEAYYRVVGN